jgi:hypothetical protein
MRRPYTITRITAAPVKRESRRDFTGEVIEEKIPKATPVFLTYVMLKKPSITEMDSLTSKRETSSDFVQRSKVSVNNTTRM